MPRVAALWRYPVKSLRGEQVEVAEIGSEGLLGDRAFGIVDEATGQVLTARREPRMLFATARWQDGDVQITGPEDAPLDSDETLSRWLERPVRLVRAGPEGGVYENPRDSEHETDWMTWQGPGGAWHDSGETRVSLVSTDTLGGWAPERFRSNILLEGGGEDGFVGRQVRLGSVTLDVNARVGRCVMVTRAQPGLEVDRDVLRSIHRDRGGDLAVGAVVVEGGTVAVGDLLTPLDRVEELLHALREAGALLDDVGEAFWADKLERGRQQIAAGDAHGLQHIDGLFGGMGSFSDLLIHPANGHRVDPTDVEATNDRLDALRGAIGGNTHELLRELGLG